MQGLPVGIGGGRRTLTGLASTLFGGGYTGPGWFYSHQPADISAGLLYQDSVGTTLAYMPGAGSVDPPIGLQIDKRYGGARSTTEMAAATYATTAAGDNVTTVVSATAFTQTAGTTVGQTYLNLTTVADRFYEATCTTTGPASGTVSIFARAGSNGAGTILATSASVGNTTAPQRLIFRATGTTSCLLWATSAVATACSAASISVRELPGLHRYQATGADRPTLTGRYNELLATATLATQSVTVTAASRTLSFTGTGTVTLSGVSTAGPLVGTGANDRVSLVFTPTAGSLTLTVTGSVTLADLRLTDDAAKPIPPYQWVTDANTYDTNGFPLFLRTNGVNTWMQTAVTDWSSTDEVTVIGAFTKLSDAAAACLVELTTNLNTNNGAFAAFAPASAAANLSFISKGTVGANAVVTGPASPVTLVFTGQSNISDDTVSARVNGGTAVTTTTDQGTGNFSNAAIYWYRRGGSSSPASARDYGSIGIGKTVPLSQIVQVEKQYGRLAGVTV